MPFSVKAIDSRTFFSQAIVSQIILVLGLLVCMGGCSSSTDVADPADPIDPFEIIQPKKWAFEDSTLWKHENGVLHLTQSGKYTGPIRRPGAVALVENTHDLSDFYLSAFVKSTQDTSVVGRDIIVVFGYRSPQEFYYAHLSNDNTVMPHNGIFIVNQSDRRRIDDQGMDDPPEGRLIDTEWHQIRIDRSSATGSIQVYLDDMRTPLMTATDTTFLSGSAGFGSFDDTGAIRDIRLVAGSGPIIDPVSAPIVDGSLTFQLEYFATIPASGTTGGPLARINYLGHANDESERLFVNDLQGKMYVIEAREVTEYLNIRAQTADFMDSPGLGSGFGFFAFHPDFAENGKLYTIHTEGGEALTSKTPDYSNGPGDVVHGVLLEWTTTQPTVSPFSGSKRELLRLGFPSPLHGMQQMAFDPNAKQGDEDFGLLYIAVGDGEIPGNQTENAQSIRAHNGKIWRIDPLGDDSPNGQYGIPAFNPFAQQSDALGEIWALGLRNPHRFSWDPLTRNMYFGHIGEAQVDAVFQGIQGANYGWNLREGGYRFEKKDPYFVYPNRDSDASSRFTYPVARIDHDDIRAVVGGFVYRGDRLPDLYGKYVFGDIVLGQLFVVDAGDLDDGEMDAVIARVAIQDASGVIRSFDHFAQRSRADLRFGQDAQGEIYVLSKANGRIWTISAAVAH